LPVFRNGTYKDEPDNWSRETSVTAGIWERLLENKKYRDTNIVLKSDRVPQRAAVSIFNSQTM
jgi:hypothetical protein